MRGDGFYKTRFQGFVCSIFIVNSRRGGNDEALLQPNLRCFFEMDNLTKPLFISTVNKLQHVALMTQSQILTCILDIVSMT